MIAVWRNTTLPFFGDDETVKVRVGQKPVLAVDLYGNRIPTTREGRWVDIACSWKPVYLVSSGR